MSDEETIELSISDLRETLERMAAVNERLLAAIKRIDAINDNPADFNAEINKVCDEILRPELKD